MIKIKFWIALVLMISCFCSAAFADSLWNETSSSPYTTAKSFKVGDIVTVFILESSSAIQKAGTDTNVRDDLSASLNHTIDALRPTIDNSIQVQGGIGNKYKGLGATTRTSNVQAKVAAIVVKVLPNGNLLIKGEHKVEVNDERQFINVSGMIRPKDVSLDNTIYSHQVANASVSVRGSGPVRDAEEPGWLTKTFNWLF
ncbi:flagellar basal body L-ring protein FlgH [Candidatus Margulisiibacteriota bacterium]